MASEKPIPFSFPSMMSYIRLRLYTYKKKKKKKEDKKIEVVYILLNVLYVELLE